MVLISASVASQSTSYNEGGEGFNFEKRTIEYYTPLKVKSKCETEQTNAKALPVMYNR